MLYAPSIVQSVHPVEHPATWRGEPFALHFILLRSEPSGEELLAVYRWAKVQGWTHTRAISPQTLVWSSLFQPRFFEAINRELGVRGMRLACRNGSTALSILLDNSRERVRFWLQSVIFLASVTLSAAIVQGRWSRGTLASKFDRLWMAGKLARAGVVPELLDLSICEQVLTLAANSDSPSIERLLSLRKLFNSVIKKLTADVSVRRVHMRSLPHSDKRLARFGFVPMLLEKLPTLQAVIVYGSSVSSAEFADYDAILVVDDPVHSLRCLENTHPQWAGKELNLGIYSPGELWLMQLLSGDNLADYGLCVYGEAVLPDKKVELLLVRNLSFGMVRQRQQLGMIGHALDGSTGDGDDRRNLYHYFVKIPANIAKGTFGAAGRRRTKEEIHRWLDLHCGFDTVGEQGRAVANGAAAALSNSAVATGAALRCLNEELHIVEPA